MCKTTLVHGVSCVETYKNLMYAIVKGDEMLNTRIKELRIFLELSQKEFGERLGVSRDVIANLENNRKAPQKILIQCICHVFSVNEHWILTGEGDMLSHDDDYDEILEEVIRTFNQLEPNLQEYALEQIRGLLDMQNKSRRESAESLS